MSVLPPYARMSFLLPRHLEKEGKIVMGIFRKVDPEGETAVTRRDCHLSVVATLVHWAGGGGRYMSRVHSHIHDILYVCAHCFTFCVGAEGRDNLAET